MTRAVQARPAPEAEPGMFICCECGMRIFEAMRIVPEPPLCATCLHLPGWQDDEHLHAVFDPWWEAGEKLLAIAEPARWADDGGSA